MAVTEKNQYLGDLRPRQPEKYVVRPFVKWAGGKKQLLPEIHKRYPIMLGNEIKKYAEPFVGGGAVLFDVLSGFELDEVYISDVNKELITVYKTIRDCSLDLIAALSELEKEYVPSEKDAREELFYSKRKRYNEIKSTHSPDAVELSSLFIFLNRVCFNGLYRVNSRGDYNVPHGSNNNPRICDSKNIKNISSCLKKVEIVCGDYKQSSDFIDENTFVYFDPPYRPINQTSSFTAYTDNQFDDSNQEELAKYVKTLAERGAKIMVSNSDPKNYSDDDFFDVLYSDFIIERVPASRAINSDSKKRGKINELLIRNYEEILD